MDSDLQFSPRAIFIWSRNRSDDISSSNFGRSLYKRSLSYPAMSRELIHQKRYLLNTPSSGDNSLYGDFKNETFERASTTRSIPFTTSPDVYTAPKSNASSRRNKVRAWIVPRRRDKNKYKFRGVDGRTDRLCST